MRAAVRMLFAVVPMVLAACSPEIASGSYLCGAEELCPPGEKCDGVTDSCVLATAEMPFACEAGTEIAGDDTAMTAQQVPALACVSPRFQAAGCMPPGDAADWFAFKTPSDCTTVQVQARIVFPVAYEVLSLELWDLAGNSQIGTDVPCADAVGDPAHVERCIKLTVPPGGSYGLLVKPSGQGACGGACAYNRYDLSLQLATP